MQWEIKRKIKQQKKLLRRKEILRIILKNRGIINPEKIDEFVNPLNPLDLKASNVGISSKELKTTLQRINKAFEKQESLIVYGDYDADGICAAAVLWEALYSLEADVIPFIPHREKHGYGLSISGIKEIIKDYKKMGLKKKPSLLITVDNGIVAFQAVTYAKKHGIDVIISDHHQKAGKLPKAYSIIHTTALSGAGVAWVLAKEIANTWNNSSVVKSSLDLAAIGTISDMVPLVGPNRSIVKFGLEKIRNSTRIGLTQLINESSLNFKEIETYHVNFMLAPRINAMGRLKHGLDSLRLLCTKDTKRAEALALKLGKINRQRQDLTEEMVKLAQNIYEGKVESYKKQNIIVIDHPNFHEGIIGLIAGKLAEIYYRPSIIISRGKTVSKASARSVPGFNIIEAIRANQDYLIDAGGHPMAAGFTLFSKKIKAFTKSMQKFTEQNLLPNLLEKKILLDCELQLNDISWQLYQEINNLKPFGIGNSKPKFAVRDIQILGTNLVGSDGKHLKLVLPSEIPGQPFIKAIWFNHGHLIKELEKQVNLAFSLEENLWRNKRELQLIIEDIKAASKV